MSQQLQTETFFDGISDDYSAKYEQKSVFHAYFFNQRLQKATAQINFDEKHVLDIGSGTGNLFAYIHSQYPKVDFYATDISAGMLSQSPVPSSHKFQGNCYEVALPLSQFDYITMLGVSTYMDAGEMSKTLQFVNKYLTAEGTYILTFTNRLSFDLFFRNLSRLPLKLMGLKGRVISGDFKIFTYSLQESKDLLKDFEIIEVGFLNQTVFPFCLLLPRVSIYLGNFMASYFGSKLLSWFSSDFIIRVKKKK